MTSSGAGGRWALLLLAAAAPRHVAAQATLGVQVGVRYSSTLVHDSIVSPFDVRPALAPAVALTLAQARRPWAPMLTLDLSTGNLTRHDADGTTTTLIQVTTVAFTVGLTHPLSAGFDAGLAVGGLKYIPSEDTGIFQEGSGGVAGLGALTIGHPFRLGSERLTIAARYDIHGFTTPALSDEGFHGLRAVHRVSLTVRTEWGGSR